MNFQKPNNVFARRHSILMLGFALVTLLGINGEV